MRKRINLSVDADFYDIVARIAKDYGFTGPCEVTMILLKMFTRRVAQGESGPRRGESIEDEIDSMFDELSDWEPTPSNTQVPKRHR